MVPVGCPAIPGRLEPL